LKHDGLINASDLSIANDSNGIFLNYDYDVFGVEKEADPYDINPFRYCGKDIDLSSSLIYLRVMY
jgi:hypothetical protein